MIVVAVLSFATPLACIITGVVFGIGPDDNLLSRDTWRRSK